MARRIVIVTLGLMAAGYVFGTLASVVILALWAGPADGLRVLLDPGMYRLAAEVGGTLGAIMGPLFAWGLMRHVPLWLAVAGTALGTILGGMVGSFVEGGFGIFWAAPLGFAIAAVWLRMRAARAQTPRAARA